jgi:hypothetical protein
MNKNDNIKDDFIKYAKEQYNFEISLKKSNTPDTFESIFGTSFIKNKNNIPNKHK